MKSFRKSCRNFMNGATLKHRVFAVCLICFIEPNAVFFPVLIKNYPISHKLLQNYAILTEYYIE